MSANHENYEVRDPKARVRPNESEEIQLLAEASQQYKEYIRIAELADLSDQEEEFRFSNYNWDGPIGLVVTEPVSAKLA